MGMFFRLILTLSLYWDTLSEKLFLAANFQVSVRQCLLSTDTFKSNSMLGTHLHTMIRTHHFDFNIEFKPIGALMSKN